MPKFSANLTMMFNEAPFIERFGAAARAGFRGVEYVSPYEHPKEVIAALLKEHGLTQALFNLPAGDWNAGERGMACIPGREEEFRASVAKAIDYALALNCKTVNCLSGIKPAGADEAEMRATFVANLRYAAAEIKKAGVLLIAEPINFYDMPGFYLNTSKQALSIFDEVGSDNLKLQYDIYHMQRMEGEIAATIERLLPRIGHFQIAANPGRHEPDYGEINYPWLYQFIDGLGYTGWIGAEYKPRGKTEDGLGWLKAAQTV
ncbi:MAG: 2-oxo-tetronate isomerase [Beijerinckiaceae bacterium]